MKNNKGFMLAEVVITSTVVLTSLVSLYVTFNKLYKNYNTRAAYYNVDGIYAAREMVNSLIATGEIGNILSRVSPEKNVTATEKYIGIIVNNSCDYGTTFCSTLQKEYAIENLYIIKYEKESIEAFKKSTIKNTFKDYIDFTITYYNITEKKAEAEEETTTEETTPEPTEEPEEEEEENEEEEEESSVDYSGEPYNYLIVLEYKNSNNNKYNYSSIRLG